MYQKKYSEEDAVLINGKKYLPHHFKPGNQAAKANKGQIKRAIFIDHSFSVSDSREFKTYMSTYGISRVMAILNNSNDKDFVKLFFTLAPYCIPKIKSIKDRDDDNSHSITGNQVNHTVTIIDMRNNPQAATGG